MSSDAVAFSVEAQGNQATETGPVTQSLAHAVGEVPSSVSEMTERVGFSSFESYQVLPEGPSQSAYADSSPGGRAFWLGSLVVAWVCSYRVLPQSSSRWSDATFSPTRSPGTAVEKTKPPKSPLHRSGEGGPKGRVRSHGEQLICTNKGKAQKPLPLGEVASSVSEMTERAKPPFILHSYESSILMGRTPINFVGGMKNGSFPGRSRQEA